MFQLPCALHPLEQFFWRGVLYVADLQTREVLQIDPLIGKILDLCPSAETDEILFLLKGDYPEAEVLESLGALAELALKGLLFSCESEITHRPDREAGDQKRLKIFAPKQMRFGKDMTWQTIGAPIAHLDLLSAPAFIRRKGRPFTSKWQRGIRNTCFYLSFLSWVLMSSASCPQISSTQANSPETSCRFSTTLLMSNVFLRCWRKRVRALCWRRWRVERR